jgi:hypothetical protein
MNTEANGERSANTQREEGRKEEFKGFYLHKSSSATDRSYDRGKGDTIIIHIENTSKPTSVTVHKEETKTSIKNKIYTAYPSLFSSSMGIEFFSAPIGSANRKVIEDPILDQNILWATIYLTKH